MTKVVGVDGAFHDPYLGSAATGGRGGSPGADFRSEPVVG
jgi:hypothetical protein